MFLLFRLLLFCVVLSFSYGLVFYTTSTLLLLGLCTAVVFAVVVIGILIPLAFPSTQTIPDSCNKAIIITGCDTGFGNRLARRLDSLGFITIACCLSPDQDGSMELQHRCSSRLHTIKLDVRKNEDIENAKKHVDDVLQKTNSELWGLVNNAGISLFMPFEWCSTFDVLNVFNVNTFGPVNMTRTFLPHLRKSRGRIVNVASAGGRNSYPNSLIYCMSKHALVALSDGLRRELAPFGISVASIEPQAYKTALFNADKLRQSIKSSFGSCSEHVKETYGEGYDDRLAEALISSIHNDSNVAIVRDNINEVVDCMVHALTAVTPKHRYCPPEPLTIIAEFCISILPSNLLDRIFNTLLAPLSYNKLSLK